jgi:hypothetical protein
MKANGSLNPIRVLFVDRDHRQAREYANAQFEHCRELGWLIDMDGDTSSMLSPEDYVKFLGEGWEATQRTLKGQLN